MITTCQMRIETIINIMMAVQKAGMSLSTAIDALQQLPIF